MKQRVFIALLFGLAACAPTDTGNPPAALDASKLESDVVQGFVDHTVWLDGRAGAVDGSSGEVYLVALDVPSEAARVEVEPDGSFGVVTLTATNTRVRAFARTDEGLSAATDWQIEVDRLVELPRALDACVEVVRTLEADEEGQASLSIFNGCSSEITLSASAIGAEVAGPVPASLEVGGEGSWSLSIPVPSSGFAIGTIALRVSGAVSGVLEVSLLSRAP